MKIVISGSRGLAKGIKDHLLHHDIRLLPKIECDIRDYAQVALAIENANNDMNGLDVLVNCAAVNHAGRIEDVNPEQIYETFQVNAIGALNLTKAAVHIMKPRGGGHIININSELGLRGAELQSLYSSSKWALRGASVSLAEELADFGIKVTNISLGSLDKTMLEDGRRGTQIGLQYIEVADIIDFIITLDKEIHVPEIGIRNVYS